MYLIISHFTQNKWTTDYLLDYFERNTKPYYYLRHPFHFEKDLDHSELLYFDGKKAKVISKYKKSNNFLLDIIRNILLSFYVWLQLFSKVDVVIWFWGFNIFPFLYVRLFWKQTIFWGADYSKKRFWSHFLNTLYLFLETISCTYSTKVINSSYRQQEARIQNNGLKKEKSLIINNWISKINFKKKFNNYQEVSFFYLGSITHQHGIIDFIKHFYIEKNLKNKLYIVWGGELENELLDFIKENYISDRVTFMWRKNQQEVIEILTNIDEKLFWIAPYTDTVNDHVYYGDSLKIREYLNYNIPFLVSSIVYISEDIRKFWIIYSEYSKIDFNELAKFDFDWEKKNLIMEKYYWDNLLKIF